MSIQISEAVVVENPVTNDCHGDRDTSFWSRVAWSSSRCLLHSTSLSAPLGTQLPGLVPGYKSTIREIPDRPSATLIPFYISNSDIYITQSQADPWAELRPPRHLLRSGRIQVMSGVILRYQRHLHTGNETFPRFQLSWIDVHPWSMVVVSLVNHCI